MPPPWLAALAGLALAGLAMAAMAPLSRQPAAGLHMGLAAGIMPLILGAMIYFTPVLTRSGPAPALALLAPAAALLGGAGTVAALYRSPALVPWAAVPALGGALGLMLWMGRRSRRALAVPHPCLSWYLAALACLSLGLLGVLAAAQWPDHWPGLRRLHLHLNTLGFVGLTALATLRVLLPTVAAYADPRAGQKLRRELPLMLGGALLVATGAAWYAPLAWAGVLLWLTPPAALGLELLGSRRKALWGWHRPATSLAAAVPGLMAAGLAGVLQGAGVLEAGAPGRLFLLAFLLPLVSGAASWLVPLWLRPGLHGRAHGEMVLRLSRHTGARTLLFALSGVLSAAGVDGAGYLAGGALLLFTAQAAAALRTLAATA